ncbi:MAG: S8 family serine peptidase [Chitinophagaceae bacterium]|jgi:subtilisin family serine protease|nr:S8 family serine peptidase [Chitinophagaceae bacterium]
MKKVLTSTKWMIPLIVVSMLAGCSKDALIASAELTDNNAASSNASAGQGTAEGGFVDGSYIVVFNNDLSDVDGEVNNIARSQGIKANYTYKHVIKGFAAKLPAAALNALKNNPRVRHIEQDQYARTVATQSPATWGLDRVDQVNRPLSGSYTYNTTGASVDAYIFDTGIWFTHNEFGGRAKQGYDAFGGTGNDDNGHGTHVAGTVGGTTYGIAKGVTLYAVKVLNSAGSGTYSGIIAGLDWAVNHHTTKPAVGNMSLGGGASATLDDAVRRCIADGIIMCVAAGNSTADAINYSPARTAEAITVGATSSTDGFASFSNFGSVVDILAPGVSITSAWFGSNTVTSTISGTSMASPHVAGVSALYLEAYPGSTTAAVSTGLKAVAGVNLVSSVPAGTPNLLLYTGFATTPPTAPTTPAQISPANGATQQAVSTTIAWSAVTGAASYRVQWSLASDFSSIVGEQSVTGTSATISGLANATTYYWRVNASNSVGTSNWSATWSFTTANAVTLSAPVLVSPADGATGVATNAKLIWNTVSGAATYQLQMSLAADFSTIAVSRTNLTGTTITITKLRGKTRYYWRMRAVNANGTVTSGWSTRSFTTR